MMAKSIASRVVFFLSVSAAVAYPALPRLNISPGSVTVAGQSAGGAMATQVHVAYSGTFTGVGVFAGQPYWCYQGTGSTNADRCQTNSPALDSTVFANKATALSSSGSIDSISNLSNDLVYIFHGTNDGTVDKGITNSVHGFYRQVGVPVANINYVSDKSNSHVFPTLSNGNYDGAQAVLSQVYGVAFSSTRAEVASNWITYDQSLYYSGSIQMANVVHMYVPSSCQSGSACRLHVFLHGCSGKGLTYAKSLGYGQWAEGHGIVIMFPQNNGGGAPGSTNSDCFDWEGWTTSNYIVKTAPQISAIYNMVKAVTG